MGYCLLYRIDVKPESLLPSGIKRNELGRCVEETKLRFPDPEHGTDRQYHAISRGFILNEIFRRVDPKGRTVGEALRKDVAEKLEVDVHIGLKEDELERVRMLKVSVYIQYCV